ncbi:hypothetical protein EBT16_12960 [bacterium]|nr:hypothetical protein [bacterium]
MLFPAHLGFGDLTLGNHKKGGGIVSAKGTHLINQFDHFCCQALKMKDADEGYGAGLFGDDDEDT